MPIINISVKDKIANAECGAKIVCKNSDYVAKFSFDKEWDEYYSKTARFAYDSDVITVAFKGDECKIPKLPNTISLQIEVRAGDIKTAVPAWIDCIPVLDDSFEEIEPPKPNVYDQIMQLINDIDKRLEYLPSEEEIIAIKNVRDDLTDLTRRFEALANSDDETLDQLAEIVAYIKSNKTLIDSITTSKVSVSDIINSLDSNAIDKPLSAKQGLVLNEKITNVSNSLEERTSEWYAQSPNARIPILENFRIGSEPLIYVSTYAPDLVTQYETIIDGATYLFKFAHLDVDGLDFLVPDFLIGENGILNNSFGVVALIDSETLDTAIYSTDNNEHIVSFYQLGIRKLPEKYLPMDTELDETSERPIQNKVVAKAIGDISTALDELHAYAQNLIGGN